jgi:nucleotide-binding universal stress UspA family protein
MKINYLLSLIVLAALAWAFVNPPVAEPLPRSLASRATTSDPVTAPRSTIDSNLLEVHRPPIPLMRTVRALPRTAATPDVAMADADVQAPDNRDIGTAKAAIEADGYKRVSVIGKQGNGTWRAKAYRGQTEVQLTVDGAGRVSLE